ncbi:hypothetical protein SAMN04515620_13423 [Collimonas sp. OK607]|uniref:hypothetical protein n=1 Tax=Collimonas sp. OK607 TaxID=1798194 RepID=UPI0008F0132A|nr:hypothetical protein [Collimonas sp. OK607]SFB27740.1 hypothetical protein SAMN04515620_13423 [Collimonas sp. OK607]
MVARAPRIGWSKVARQLLGERLKRSVKLTNSPGEYAIFRIYHEIFGKNLGDRLPALIPQVYLRYDPLTQNELAKLGKDQVLERQRMDFLMLLDGHVRIIIEEDGKEHYAEGDKASPRHYAKMAEDWLMIDKPEEVARLLLYRG